MAPVIWGLNLGEIQWSKFKSSYMWNNTYHLRRTKFIVYQCALIFCVVSESLGTDVLSTYIDMERHIQTIDPRAHVYNNDYVGAGSYNIFAGVSVATIFGAAFFFDLFWPERHESKSVRTAWKVCGVLAMLAHLASALTITIITALHRSRITGVSPQRADELLHGFKKHRQAPLVYRHNARAVAAVVFAWLGWVSVVGSCILLFLSIRYTAVNGPFSRHAMHADAEKQSSQDLEKEVPSVDASQSIQETQERHTGTPRNAQHPALVAES